MPPAPPMAALPYAHPGCAQSFEPAQRFDATPTGYSDRAVSYSMGARPNQMRPQQIGTLEAATMSGAPPVHADASEPSGKP